ncbi:hypothetical protein Taro_049531 [Colocasia esculenta]|uniref:Uncharacterized protein n=1 Tax=Colocasia esculenta TaxID=4460 RepID=A0A843XB96_COLES|nr:hypothetical protein [Colocasia esculenta]
MTVDWKLPRLQMSFSLTTTQKRDNGHFNGVVPFGCEGRPGGIQGVVPFGCEGRPGVVFRVLFPSGVKEDQLSWVL